MDVSSTLTVEPAIITSNNYIWLITAIVVIISGVAVALLFTKANDILAGGLFGITFVFFGLVLFVNSFGSVRSVTNLPEFKSAWLHDNPGYSWLTDQPPPQIIRGYIGWWGTNADGYLIRCATQPGGSHRSENESGEISTVVIGRHIVCRTNIQREIPKELRSVPRLG